MQNFKLTDEQIERIELNYKRFKRKKSLNNLNDIIVDRIPIDISKCRVDMKGYTDEEYSNIYPYSESSRFANAILNVLEYVTVGDEFSSNCYKYNMQYNDDFAILTKASFDYFLNTDCDKKNMICKFNRLIIDIISEMNKVIEKYTDKIYIHVCSDYVDLKNRYFILYIGVGCSV